MTAPAPGARRQRGVTLVQIMVGSSVGLMLTYGMVEFLAQGSRSSREDINVATMLDELSYGAAQLGADLEMAGFWAQVHDPGAVTRDAGLAVGADCGPPGWFSSLRALEVLDNPTPADAAAAHPCLDAGALVEGADVIAVKRVLGRVVGTDTALDGLRNGAIYLRTHDRYGVLYLHGTNLTAAVDEPWQNWEYAPTVYFVQRYTVSASESPRVPALCRMVLRASGDAAPSFVRECVAQGIENVQVEIGVDSDEDGSANYFTQSPTAGDLDRASSARLYLLGRSARPDPQYENAKTFQIGNAAPYTPVGADGHYYRKALSTEVALRNPRALQGVAVQ